MAINKLSLPAKENAVQLKINEIIDNLGGGGSITVDQTYNSTSANAQSGVAINGAKFVQNTATGTGALTLLGTSTTSNNGVNIGTSSSAGSGSTAVGYNTAANAARSTSLGYSARIGASTVDAIQIGYGTNSTAKSFSVGFYNNSSTHYNWQLLDGTTGKIPSDRIKYDGTTITVNANGELTSTGGGTTEYVRNIGEIVTSTIPLTDAGLHLLDGALLQYASYKDFIDYIASIYSVNANYFCSENDWQTSVTNYGVCGKFVYNSTNHTVRLPKITGFTESTIDVNALGDLVEAGLPNITGNFTQGTPSGQTFTNLSSSGAFSMTSAAGAGAYSSGSSTQRMKTLDFDASGSNSIYGNSTTVQPQSVKVLYYIVVATTTKTEIEIDIDEIATDLNGKADTDLLNVPESRGILVEKSSKDILPRWYRVYSDGWCEQGGVNTVSSTSVVASLLKNYINNNYSVMTQGYRNTYNANNTTNIQILSKSNSQINMACPTTTLSIEWQACGYIR